MDYDAVVLDNDGVLTRVTDRKLVRETIEATFEEFDVGSPAEEHVERLYGMTVEDVREICAAYDLNPATFWERRDENMAAAQIEAIRTGEKDLYEDVAALSTLPEPLGLVSNNQRQTVEYVLEHFDLVDRFGAVYGRRPTLEDLTRKKPEPFFIERALSDLGVDRALYVGDSPKDVVAAHRAGIDAAFVRRSHRADTELPTTPAYEVSDLEELVAELGR